MRAPAIVSSTRTRNGDGRNGRPNGRVGVERGASGVLRPLPVDIGQPRGRRHADVRRTFVWRGHRRNTGGAGTWTVEAEQPDRRDCRPRRRHDCRRRPTPTTRCPGTIRPSLATASMRSACARTIASWICASFCWSRRSISYLAPSLSPNDAVCERRLRTAVNAATRSGTAAGAPRLAKARDAASTLPDKALSAVTSACGGRSPAKRARPASETSMPSKSEDFGRRRGLGQRGIEDAVARAGRAGWRHHWHAALAEMHARGDAADFADGAAEKRLVDVRIERGEDAVRRRRGRTAAALTAAWPRTGWRAAAGQATAEPAAESTRRTIELVVPARAAGRRGSDRETAPDRLRRETPRSPARPPSDGAGRRQRRRGSSR